MLHGDVGELGAEDGGELPIVQFAHYYSLVLCQHLAGIERQRVDIVEVCECAVEFDGGGAEVSLCASPAYEQGVARGVALHLQGGNLLRHMV